MASVLQKRNVLKDIEPEPEIPNPAVEDGLETTPSPVEDETAPEPPEEVGVARKSGKIASKDVVKYLSKYTDSKVAPKVWFSLIKDLPSDYWSNLIVYAYRILPRIIRKKSNPTNPSNIGSYVAPFSEAEFLNLHGWGFYKLMLCDQTRKQQTNVCWCIWRPECSFDEYPPKLDLRELDVDNQENRSYVDYLKIQGKLDGSGNIIEKTNMTQAGSTDQASLLNFMERMIDKMGKQQAPKDSSELQAITKAIDLVSKGGEKATEMVLKQVGNNDPLNTVKLIEAILSTTKGDGSQMNHVYEEMKDLRKQNSELMMLLINKSTTPPPDPLENLLKYKQLLEALKEGNEDGGGARPMGWKEKALEIGIPVLGNVISVIANSMAMKNAGGKPLQQQTVPVNPEQVAGELPPGQPDQQQIIRDRLASYGPLIYRAVARGENGGNFAESLNTMFGLESGVYPAITAMGKEGIIAALMSNPMLAQQLTPMAERLDRFVDEFIAWEHESEGEE